MFMLISTLTDLRDALLLALTDSVTGPGSLTSSMSLFQNASWRGSMANRKVRASPRRKVTRSKAFNSSTGRVTETSSRVIYSWTTSSPSRRCRYWRRRPATSIGSSAAITVSAGRGAEIAKAGVGQAVAEGEQRAFVVEQIAAPGAGLMVVEEGDLALIAHDRDRQLGAGIDATQQRLGHRRCRLPGPDTSIRASASAFATTLGQLGGRPLIGARSPAACRAPPAHRPVRSARRRYRCRCGRPDGWRETFAAGLFGIADGSTMIMSAVARDFDRFGYQPQVLVPVGKRDHRPASGPRWW